MSGECPRAAMAMANPHRFPGLLILPHSPGTADAEDGGCLRPKELSMPRPHPAQFRCQTLTLVTSDRTVVDVAASLWITQQYEVDTFVIFLAYAAIDMCCCQLVRASTG
jgi:hypothetical protein